MPLHNPSAAHQLMQIIDKDKNWWQAIQMQFCVPDEPIFG